VNDQLVRLGYKERMAKADNYFLFTGGAADEWLDRTDDEQRDAEEVDRGVRAAEGAHEQILRKGARARK
jgi:hypothetical protein